MSYNLSNFVGQTLNFQIDLKLESGNRYTDTFKGKILEVTGGYIIVEQLYIQSDEDFKEKLVSQKRKLMNDSFTIVN